MEWIGGGADWKPQNKRNPPIPKNGKAKDTIWEFDLDKKVVL